MRPIEKWAVGTNGVSEDYDPYQSAKSKLVENLGDYCSYCGRQLDEIALEVEHILPKSVLAYSSLKFKWDNFLLACKSCNLAKGTIVLDSSATYFPHLSNTFAAFSISLRGSIIPRPSLNLHEKAIAETTIKAIGLDREPGNPALTEADDRYKYRRNAHQVAKKYLYKYENGLSDLETICDLAKAYGFWLVWMEVFSNNDLIQKALVGSFRSTYSNWKNQAVSRI